MASSGTASFTVTRDGLIEAALRTQPDIVIIDDAMPRMNGVESARRIHQRLAKTEICLLTDSEEETVIAHALPAGVRGFVLKSESLLDHFVKHIGLPQKVDLLTPREREVVQLVAEGLSNKQVGRHLHLSIKTIETHRSAAMRKAGLSSTADLVRYAVRNHLVHA